MAENTAYYITAELAETSIGVAGNATPRLLTCDPDGWQTWFCPHLLDGFFLWTLFKFRAPLFRFAKVLDFQRRKEYSGLRLSGETDATVLESNCLARPSTYGTAGAAF